MSILDEAQAQDVKRLLELFPVVNLKEGWPEKKGTKDEICYSAASDKDDARIVDFLVQNFGCCKQHVYVFDRPQAMLTAPTDLTAGERIWSSANGERALFVVRVRYTVLLRDPLEEGFIEFLWPVLIELHEAHLAVRFVVLQKSMAPYFDRAHYVAGRTAEEEDVIKTFSAANNLSITDLHAGIKSLWAEGFMDSPKAHYKKPISTALEAMDEERGIREHNPALYEEIATLPLFRSMFVIPQEKKGGTEIFFVDPAKGYLVFPRYSEEKGDTDFVIGEILRHNQ